MGMTVWTVGHSTRPWEEFLAILENFTIDLVVDIRTYPSSAYQPQYNGTDMAERLPPTGTNYLHLPRLGGRRHPLAAWATVNGGWRHAAFRGYADYMQTPDFATGLSDLMDLASLTTTAIMCAEAVPWKCHRTLVTDALLARGVDVVHLMSETKSNPAKMTEFAVVDGVGGVTYPAAQMALPVPKLSDPPATIS